VSEATVIDVGEEIGDEEHKDAEDKDVEEVNEHRGQLENWYQRALTNPLRRSTKSPKMWMDLFVNSHFEGVEHFDAPRRNSLHV